ncbi:flagellar hook-length control protein FliK, partial [Cryobacterium levicorallinum]
SGVGTGATASSGSAAAAVIAPTASGAPAGAAGAQAPNAAAAAAATFLTAVANEAGRGPKLGAVRIVTTDAAAPSPTPGLAAPTVPAASLTPVAAPAPVASAVPVPLAAQIAKPLFSLANLAPGQHTLTITVNPDNLGPVTVRAHVSPDNIRVELFAPTDLAREALRAIMPDLRRDLAGGGLSAQLDLSSQNQAGDLAGDSRGTKQPRPEQSPRNLLAREPDIPNGEQPLLPFTFGSASTIDVMA